MPTYREPLSLDENNKVHLFNPCDRRITSSNDVKPMMSTTYCLTSGTKNLATFGSKEQGKFLRKGQMFNGYFVKTHTGPYDYCFKMWTRRQLPFPPLNLITPKATDIYEVLIFDKNGPYYAVALESFLAFCTEESLKSAGYVIDDTKLPNFGVKARLEFTRNRPKEMSYVAFKAIPVSKDSQCSSKTLLLPNYDIDQLIKDQKEIKRKQSFTSKPRSRKNSRKESISSSKAVVKSEPKTIDNEKADSEDDSAFKSLEGSTNGSQDESNLLESPTQSPAPPQCSRESSPVSHKKTSTPVGEKKPQPSEPEVSIVIPETIISEAEENPASEVKEESILSKEPHELVTLSDEVTDCMSTTDPSSSKNESSLSNKIVGSISGFLKNMVNDPAKSDAPKTENPQQ